MTKKDFLQVGIILYGIYIFDEFIIQIASIINIATGNYQPSRETAAGFAIFGFVRLVTSLVLISKAGKIAGFIFRAGDNA